MINKKEFIRVFTIFLLVSVILGFYFVIVNINHNCTHNDNCFTCTLIRKFSNDLNGFNPKLLEIIITTLMIFLLKESYINKIITDKKKYTLIGLKVELLN